MKAALCKSLDGPAHLEIVELPSPDAGAGQVVVRVCAVGLNFADTLITRGKYQFKPELPFSPGAEIAGVVHSIGPGVVGWMAGDRVIAYVNWGGARELVAVEQAALIANSDGVSDAVAAGVTVTCGTAMHGLRDRAELKAGETVVVTGAAGGAGQAAIEVAKLMGARVIAVASSQDKLDIAARSGADAGILFPGGNLTDAVKTLTNGKGVDVVYDCIGGDAAEPLVRALGWQGRFLVVGFASGEIPKVPINLLLLKGADLRGVFWGEFVRREPAAHQANMALILKWIADGRLNPKIHAEYPLSEISTALSVIERREAAGKVVLTM